jgi:hypothetical protein
MDTYEYTEERDGITAEDFDDHGDQRVVLMLSQG